MGDLQLKLLGVLFALGTSATQFNVSSHTNLSEEGHQRFFIDWTAKMSSLKAEYIYMPRDDTELRFVVGEYEALGLPGCIGSVDCVHIGWLGQLPCPDEEHVHRQRRISINCL